MTNVVISGTGLYHPKTSVSNEELVVAFNAFVDKWNTENAADIDAGLKAPRQYSDPGFIEKASGIKSRHIVEGSGILDPERMTPRLPDDAIGDDDNPSLQARWSLEAADGALKQAGIEGKDIDLVICSAALLQRFFPAISIEVQKHIGATGAAFDMVAACSAATFGLLNGIMAIKTGMAKRVLVVNPEIFTTMVNYRDRDSHFIFGDVCMAVVLEAEDIATAPEQWLVEDTKWETRFSSNIRSEFGPLTRLADDAFYNEEMYFVQQGRKVFKELLPMVCEFIASQIEDKDMTVTDLQRMWLHQANVNMNMYAAKKLLGREPTHEDAPVVLDTYGNTAGAGSILAFHLHRDDLKTGDAGLICSFGAGYSIGSLMVRKK